MVRGGIDSAFGSASPGAVAGAGRAGERDIRLGRLSARDLPAR
ncbi:hypothetical protein [Actinophytocola sp.]|nr:hypothetical protein [Actinophytocola sp.]